MTKKNLIIAIVVFAAILGVGEMCGLHLHAAHFWFLPFAFNFFFGLVGAFILIFVSKKIMAVLLQRDPDYYDEGGDEK